ncbi:TolC family protein [Bdellovibrio sp. SKB1291214]|uniref:TolC family protein n=1 Tax=Bdellovibrio sp. SKB1291214 TaxID=1732569 RepID=UPI001C3D10A9|nr:TolC family protein [Bdellovibrio sp. SKB1291214]UYL09381.1 TolC family protein [Bdellovibrio sp. SKB1291214]
MTIYSSLVWAEQPLSFQEALNLVKKNNADLQYSEETYKASKYTVESSKSGYFPQLSAALGYSQTGTSSDGAATATSSGDYSATLTASQNLFKGFADSSKVEQARGNARVSEAALRSTRSQVSYDLKSAFASAIYASDSVKISEDIVKRRNDNLRIVQLRFESGRENKGSLLLSQANYKQAQLDSLKAKHDVDTSQADLKKVVGIDSEETVLIKDDLPLTTPTSKEPDFKSIAMGTPNRETYEAQVAVSEANLRNTRSGFFPSLDLSATVGDYGQNFYPNTQDRWTLGATLTLPLFNGGRDYYATKSVTSQLYAAKSNLAGIDRSLLSTLKKAYKDYVEAVEQLAVNDAYVLAARTRADIARAKYNNGLMSFEDWDTIENDLINKTKQYLTSKRDRIIAEAAWEKAQGVGALL